ncbi:MAG: hypothetical protein H6648_08810 [Caldilineae bacterium]|nr:hypothetical protein [Caldilineae bacterium]
MRGRAATIFAIASVMLFGFAKGHNIGDGMSEIASGDSRVAAAAALDSAYLLIPMSQGPLSFLTLAYRVIEVEDSPGSCDQKAGIADADAVRAADHVVVIQTYSFFGVPLKKYYFLCSGMVMHG